MGEFLPARPAGIWKESEMKKTKILMGCLTLFLASVCVSLAYTTSFQQGVSPTTAYDQGATYIRSGDQADEKLDGDTDLEWIVGTISDPSLARGLLEFDLGLIQAATEIDSVSLILTTHATRTGIGGTQTFNVHAYDYDLVETDSTWNDPDGDGGDVTGDPTDGGTLGALLASATFDVTQTGLTVTFTNSAAFRSAVTSALADDNILRLIVVNSDETLNGHRFARFAVDHAGPLAPRPKLVVSHNVRSAAMSTFQEGVAPDAGYTHHATFIHAGIAGENRGSDANLYAGVGSGGDVVRALLKFDISSMDSSSVIDEASLTFTTHTAAGKGGNNTFNLYAYEFDFDETTATWNIPGGGAGAGGSTNGTLLTSATFDTTVTSAKVTFGDAAAFRAALREAVAGDGFLRMILANVDESVAANFANFSPDDAATEADRPKLEVISHLPPLGTVISIN